MKNIPSIGNNSPIPTQILPAIEKIASNAQKAKLDVSDASILNLPKTKAINNDSTGVETALSSLLSNLDNSALETAHSGLDASRVADLLSDD